jgi:hypothetical protein
MTTTINGSYPAVNSDSDATINGLTVGKGTGAIVGNTALGASALSGSNTGTGLNVAVGGGAMGSNTSGAYNTAIGGQNTLYSNTTGSYNVAVGNQALLFNTTASYNVAVGFQAGLNMTTGQRNTVIGTTAGSSLTTGSNNTFVGCLDTTGGNAAGAAITTGSKNSILGNYTGNQGGLDIRTASNYVVLSDGDGNPRAYWNGANATFNGTLSATGISSSGQISTLVGAAVTSFSSVCQAGDQTATNLKLTSARADVFYHIQAFNSTTTECFRVEANGNTKNTNNSYGSLSDVKLKENIIDATPKLADLMQVKVRNYNLIGDTTKQIGVIAQELETVFPSMVDENKDRDEDGNLLETTTKGVKYSVFVPILIKAIQELKAEVDSLKQQLGK